MNKFFAGALLLCLTTAPVLAQNSPADIRAALGGPIDIEQGALFAATRSSHKALCGGDPDNELHASVINRLQYGSVDAGPDKERFQQIMMSQAQSNANLFAGIDAEAQEAFCDGLNRTVTSMAADFVEAHPVFFTETKAPVAEEKEPGLDERIRTHVADLDPNLRLYVIKMAENAAYEDVKSLFDRPENDNPEGQLWLFKVLSSEMMLLSIAAEAHFPDISGLYSERGEMYAQVIRGDIEWDEMEVLEPKHEAAKTEAFMAHFNELQRTNPNLNPDMAEAEAAIKALSGMVIGGGKFLSVAK